jgi:ribonuclease HI
VVSERYSTRIKNRALHIHVHEMRAVLHALRLWLPRLCGGKVIIYGDNAAVVAGLNKGSIRGGPMATWRDIAMLLALNDILMDALWIDSKSNDLADLLSRSK